MGERNVAGEIQSEATRLSDRGTVNKGVGDSQTTRARARAEEGSVRTEVDLGV